MTSGVVRVGLLRYPAAGDPLADRLRLDVVLARAEVAPSGLSPSAVLCVRQLDDPRPRTLRLDAGAIRPPPAWERAVSSELESALRSAARPAQGMVPATANAVYFADQAEVLACLARDWLSGTAATRWWWRGLGLATSPTGALGAAFEQAPRHVPRALVLLAEWSWAVPVVHAFEPAEAARVALAVGTEFGLVAVVRAADQLRQPAASRTALSGDHRVSQSTVAHAPWVEVVPEVAALRDQPAGELLLGTGLAIMRIPVAVRSPGFGKAVAVWAASVLRASSPRSVRPNVAELQAATVSQPHAEMPRVPVPPEGLRPVGVSEAESARPSARPRGRSRPRAAQRQYTSLPDARPRDSEESIRPAIAIADLGTRPTLQPLPGESLGAANGSVALEQSVEPIRTGLGGAFYLLNLALYLGLYGDFTQPQEPGIELDPWDLVALLAGWLGAARESKSDDIWPLLAALANREQGQPPGHDFRPPSEWRAPPEWLDPFRGDSWREPWRWSAAGGRIVVEHPAGFPVLDVPSQDRPSKRRVAASLRRYGRIAPLRRTALPSRRCVGRPFERWLTWLADYARARLAIALGCPPDAVSDVLFCHDARVVVTSTTVDVEMSLADLPISVRVAGLDRDPGWIPAARRAVRFHFE